MARATKRSQSTASAQGIDHVPGAEAVTTVVTLVDVLPGSPPAIVTRERTRQKSGAIRTFTQEVPVSDPSLFERLVAVARVGDELEVTVVTDWSQPGLPTRLEQFSLLRVPVL